MKGRLKPATCRRRMSIAAVWFTNGSRALRGRRSLRWNAAFAFSLAAQSIILGEYRAAAQVLLYEDRLADGYAYIRFANTTQGALTMKPVGFADPLALGTSGADRISSYYTVEKVSGRTLTVRIEPAGQIDFQIKPGAFQTLTIDKTGSGIKTKIVTDRLELSQTKARLAFYNLMTSCAAATLYLDPKGQVIFKDVGVDGVQDRSVNPAADPQVHASCGAAKVAALHLGSLDAGGQYSLWLMAPGGNPTAFLSKNKIAPYMR